MDLETVQAKLKYNELKQRYSYLDAEASGLITLIRIHVNPLTDDVTNIQVDEASKAMGRLRAVITEMNELKKRLGELKSRFGE